MKDVINSIINLIEYFIENLKIFCVKKYKELSFILKKQSTIQNMYKPIIEEKTIINNKLNENLIKLKSQNSNVLNVTEKLQNENSILKEEIAALQKLLIVESYDN